jgi:hydroxyethylthiazole kinase-like uncharacterized protein yjeF
VRPAPTATWLAAPPADPPVRHDAHKGRFGDVVVVGGAAGMQGAAALAGHAALAAGAGRVYVGLLDAQAAADATAPTALRPELMRRPLAALLAPALLATRTVVAGCGGGEAIAGALPVLLRHAARLVLDADALNAVAGDAMLREALAARGRRGGATVLTPHPLEAARLLGDRAAEVQADRPAAARALAERFGAVVVLKGSGTLVARPGGALALHAVGNARLATAGTGDVLAGWLGGEWSRRGGAGDAAADAAVWRHGRAAEAAADGMADGAGRDATAGAAGGGPLLAADLVGAMQRTAAGPG